MDGVDCFSLVKLYSYSRITSTVLLVPLRTFFSEIAGSWKDATSFF